MNVSLEYLLLLEKFSMNFFLEIHGQKSIHAESPRQKARIIKNAEEAPSIGMKMCAETSAHGLY